MKKISVPFFVADAQHTVNRVLKIIFRGDPANRTTLRDFFVPLKIKFRDMSPQPSFLGAKGAKEISLYGGGILVKMHYATYNGDSGTPDRSMVITLQIKAKLPERWRWMGSSVEFCVPVSDILQAEDNLVRGMSPTDVMQIEAKKKQSLALHAIHGFLAGW